MPSDPQAVLAAHTPVIRYENGPLREPLTVVRCRADYRVWGEHGCDAVVMARALAESEKRVKAVLEAAETEWLNGNMEESAFDRIEARAALLEGEPDAR